MQIYFSLVLGLILGSFYNVCIYRLPLGKSIVSPRSSCGSCGHVLSGLDMIPVLTYIFNKGRCRHCKKKYSFRYPFVELLTGFLFALCYNVYGFSFEFAIGIILSSIVIIVSFIDIDHHIILDRFSVITICLAVVYHFYMRVQTLPSIGLGFLVGGGFLFIIAIIGTMGGGDIKIMASYGLLLGLQNTVIAFYLAFVVGALLLLPVVLHKRGNGGKFESKIPFGPFLSFATLATYLYSDIIIDFYFKVFML